jgi:hypothetical protein
MPGKDEKEKRKKIMKDLQQKADEQFETSLPIGRNVFKTLFDHLDEQLGEHDCDNSLKITEAFLSANSIENAAVVIHWLREHSGYCDCEVLANVEQLFEN